MGEEITLLIKSQKFFCGVFCGEFQPFLRKPFWKRNSVINSLFSLGKKIAKKGGKKSPEITTIACMMEGFSQLAGSQQLDQSFGGATWSPAGLWRWQLELLPGVKRWNEPLGKQAIGTGPLVASPNTRQVRRVGSPSLPSWALATPLLLIFLFSYFPFISLWWGNSKWGAKVGIRLGRGVLGFYLGFYHVFPLCSHQVTRFTETGDEMRSQDQKQTQGQQKKTQLVFLT